MSNRHQQRGFSLLEVLVVLLIIGLMVSMAGLSLESNRSRDLSAIARNVLQQMRLAREEAILLDRQFGWLLEEVDATEDATGDAALANGGTRYRYRWLRYEEEHRQWRELRGQSGYRGTHLPTGVSAELTVEGLDYALSLDKASVMPYSYEQRLEESEREHEDIPPPQLMFLSSGEITAFSLSFSLLDSLQAPVLISADSDGALRLEDSAD